MKIPKDVARKFAIKKQEFQYPQAAVRKEQVFNVIKALGCVQIDTINVIERSHYLVLWSRLGCYDKEYLNQLLYPDRRVFEYWAHAASIIPIEYYPYFAHAMKERRKEMRSKAKRWLKEKANLLDLVLGEIKHKGPLCSKDFRHEETREKKKQEDGWWNWKPPKIALELLYDAGILMVARREKFQKYYDLVENVLPSNIDTGVPTEQERQRFFLERTLGAWGIAEPRDIGYYFYNWSTKTNMGVKALSGLIKTLEKEGMITKIEVEGNSKPCLMLSHDTRALQKTANDEEKTGFVSLLSPFDNLTWGKPRMRKLFEFHTALETYVPRETRKFGYYTLNILYDSQIVGKLDPKMHRDKATLEIKALELKQDFKQTRDFKQHLIETLYEFMKFHNAQTVVVAKNCPQFLKNIHSY